MPFIDFSVVLWSALEPWSEIFNKVNLHWMLNSKVCDQAKPRMNSKTDAF